jgi:hypothetical protein
MRSQVIGVVVLACAGGVLAWLALRGSRSHEGASSPAPAAIEHPEPSATTSITKPAVPASPIQRRDVVPQRGPHDLTLANRGSGPAPALETAAADTAGPPKMLSLPESTAPADADRSERLKALLNSSTLRCDIYAAQGANWSSGKAITHGIQYGGGQFWYQAIDVESGTATMTGTSGVTGSPTGDLDVRVTPMKSGLSFSGITRRGEIVIVTVYAAADTEGHYPAVMSRHGPMLNQESAQFYGGCDTTLSQR